MKASELRTKSTAELTELLAATRKEMLENKRSLAAGELPNPQVVTQNRRDIARILSCLNEAPTNETSKGEA